MNEPISIVQMIQLMLAPGLMISACGLLLLGMNNKYSLVVNRIRLLNEERRQLFKVMAERDFTYEENVRVESLTMQISGLILRVRLVKNAVLFDTIAVAIFVITSLFIGLQYTFDASIFNYIVTILFLIGMVCVLIGVSYAAYETKKGFDIIQLEVKVEE